MTTYAVDEIIVRGTRIRSWRTVFTGMYRFGGPPPPSPGPDGQFDELPPDYTPEVIDPCPGEPEDDSKHPGNVDAGALRKAAGLAATDIRNRQNLDVEYAAGIVRTAGGGLRTTELTKGDAEGFRLVIPARPGEILVGVVHNHPPGGGIYPSDVDNSTDNLGDWGRLEKLIQNGHANPKSVQYILGPDGKLREYTSDMRSATDGPGIGGVGCETDGD